MKQDGFRDAVAVVTGAASGIGRALSAELARRGARVWMTDVDEPKLERAAVDVTGARWRRLDVTDPKAFEALAATVRDEAGRIDYLFNNAGIAVIGHYHEMEPDDVDRLIDVNLRGVFHGCQARRLSRHAASRLTPRRRRSWPRRRRAADRRRGPGESARRGDRA